MQAVFLLSLFLPLRAARPSRAEPQILVKSGRPSTVYWCATLEIMSFGKSAMVVDLQGHKLPGTATAFHTIGLKEGT